MYHNDLRLGGKLVPIIVSVSYQVENWSEVSYRYRIGLNIGTNLLLVSYRPGQKPVSPFPVGWLGGQRSIFD